MIGGISYVSVFLPSQKVTESPFPAHAGMNRRSGMAARGRPPVPRTRGDEPRRVLLLLLLLLRSPHTRG